MPLYEFRCRSCGHSFEKLCRMSDRELAPECPRCGAQAAQKEMSAPAVRSSESKGTGCAPRSGFT